MKKLTVGFAVSILLVLFLSFHVFAQEEWFVDAARGHAFYQPTDGKNVVVAIVGEGVYETTELAGRIVGFKNYTKQTTVDRNSADTRSASVIAAKGGGIAPSVGILSIRVTANGETHRSHCIDALVYAADMGADIIVYLAEPSSLQTPAGAMVSALEYTRQQGAVVVAPSCGATVAQSNYLTPVGGFAPGLLPLEGSYEAKILVPGKGVTVPIMGDRVPLEGPDIATAGLAGYVAAGMSRHGLSAEQALDVLIQNADIRNGMRWINVAAAFSQHGQQEQPQGDVSQRTMQINREYSFDLDGTKKEYYRFFLQERVRTRLAFHTVEGEFFARLFIDGSDYPIWTAQHSGQGLEEVLPAGNYVVELFAPAAARGRVLCGVDIPDVAVIGATFLDSAEALGYSFTVALQEEAQLRLQVVDSGARVVFEYSGQGRKGENTVQWSFPSITSDMLGSYRVVASSRNFVGEKKALPYGFVLEMQPSIVYLYYAGLFNPMLEANKLEFELDYAAQLDIYAVDDLGQRHNIESGRYQAGMHTVVWEGRDELGEYLPEGQYQIFLQGEGELSRTILVTIWYEILQAESFYATVEKTDSGEYLVVYFNSNLPCWARLDIHPAAKKDEIAAFAQQDFEAAGLQRISCETGGLQDGIYEYAAKVGASSDEAACVEYRGVFTIDRSGGEVVLEKGSASRTGRSGGRAEHSQIGYEEEEGAALGEKIPYYSLLLCFLALAGMVLHDKLKRRRGAEDLL
ncbi:MAG: FlgD immunoglobulin-like domain containing protein [Christensenellales bacterium]